MSHRRGFATLTALAAMILLTTYLGIGVLHSSEGQSRLSTVAPRTLDRARAWSTLDGALKDLEGSWDSQAQTFEAWSRAHPSEGLTWWAASGRLNLNTLSAFLLPLPGISRTLKSPSIDQFVSARAKLGTTTDLDDYRELIRPEALAWYTLHSLWNLNTADEVMLEAMVTRRTGEATLGSALRSWVRSFRERRVPILAADWEGSPAGLRASLAPIVTLEPELDVNEAPASLLLALLSNPNWSIEDPGEKVRRLVDERTRRPWTRDDLKALLKLPPDSQALAYLGTDTRFLEGTIASPLGRLGFIVYLGQGSGSSHQARILETTWEPL